MKKQLLTAFLTLTTAPCFATEQSNKTEFLNYLNNVQIAVKKDLQQLSHEEEILKQKFQDYNVSNKVLNELFDHPELKMQRQLSKTEKLIFGLICYRIRSLEGITFTPKTPWSIPTNDFFTFFLWNASKEDEQIFSNLSAELDIDLNRNPNSDTFKEENEELMHLIQTLTEKHCHKKDTRTLMEKMESCIGSYESLELSHIISYTRILTMLQQDIENKIQELQKA